MDDGKNILVVGVLSGNERAVLAHHLAAKRNVEGLVLAVDECRDTDPEPVRIAEVPDTQTNWDGEKYGDDHGHLKRPFGKRRGHNQHRRKR